jgi:hypothetical protein
MAPGAYGCFTYNLYGVADVATSSITRKQLYE